MPAIAFNRFTGSVPRMADHLLGKDVAAVALDCRLDHGTLQSWREPRLITSVTAGRRSVFQYGCCWVDFPDCVDYAIGPVNCEHLFTTGSHDWPAQGVLNETTCEVDWHRLGVPCAYNEPSVALGASTGLPDKDIEARAYAYRFKNALGEAGGLSRASDDNLVFNGQPVVISGWDVPDASWEVTTVMIYRTVSGYENGYEKGNTLDTTWMLVGEVAVDAASFTDTAYSEDLTEAYDNDIIEPPPAGMRGMCMVKSMNCLAGFSGKRVYFSRNAEYHNWPYYVDLDDNVCGLCECNGVLFAATDGRPYAIRAAVTDEQANARQVVRLPMAAPMTGCGNRRMAETPLGVVYPSHNGLIGLSGNSAPSIVTEALYAAEDWQAMEPSTVTPVYHDGRLFVFARQGAFVMRLASGNTGWALDNHSWLSDRNVIDAFETRAGDLMILKEDGGIYQWNRGAALRPHRWLSPELVAGVPINYGAAKLFHQNGAEHLKIRSDDRWVLDRDVLAPKAMTLPLWATGSRWQIELTGTATVRLVSLATSVKELSA